MEGGGGGDGGVIIFVRCQIPKYDTSYVEQRESREKKFYYFLSGFLKRSPFLLCYSERAGIAVQVSVLNQDLANLNLKFIFQNDPFLKRDRIK